MVIKVDIKYTLLHTRRQNLVSMKPSSFQKGPWVEWRPVETYTTVRQRPSPPPRRYYPWIIQFVRNVGNLIINIICAEDNSKNQITWVKFPARKLLYIFIRYILIWCLMSLNGDYVLTPTQSYSENHLKTCYMVFIRKN